MDSTLETPTIESEIGQWGDDADAASDQTAEIELADLDLDLSGLNEISDESLIDEIPLIDDDAEIPPTSSSDDIFGESAEPLQDLADDVDSTAEMRKLDEPQIGDTAEQPFAGGGDTAEQPNLTTVADDDLMLDVGEPVIDDEPTAEIEGSGSGVDGATMTEVGTKLDLARAYIDMGDPDGARSILNEVLEEADSEQKQEAQKLLDDLVD
jgi:pilus assembly protein FimV